MPLYNTKQTMQNPREQAMQGMNNAATTFGRMDKKKATQKADPLAPVKGAVALAQTGYTGYSLYNSVKDKLTTNSEEVAQATNIGDTTDVGEDYFLRDPEATQPTPAPTDVVPEVSNASANGAQANPSLLNNQSLNAGQATQAMKLPGTSASPGTTSASMTSPSTTTPQAVIPESVAPVEAVVPSANTVEAGTGAVETAMATTGTEPVIAGAVEAGTGAVETAMATGAGNTALAAGGEALAAGAGEALAAGSAAGPIGLGVAAALTIGSLLFS